MLAAMDQRISFVTLAVADLEASRRFYVDGLGWRAELEVPGEVVMIAVGERVVLSLWAQDGFEGEVGPIRQGPGEVPMTLAHNVADRTELEAVLDLARSAGAREVSEAVERDWGGVTGYLADPDGFRWEVAVNPGPLGQRVLPPEAREEVRRTPFGQPVGPDLTGWTPPPWPALPGPLHGRWCTLEPLTAEHAAELAPEVAAPEHAALWTYLREDPPRDATAFAEVIADRVAREDVVPVVVRDADGVACGLADLMRVDRANGVVEVGNILLGPRLARTTAATEAMHLLAAHAFDLGYRRYEWKCDALNVPSRRAATRLGFRYEGTFARHVVTKGRSRDTAWFALTDADWPAVAAAHRAWLADDNHDEGGQRRPLREHLAEAGR